MLHTQVETKVESKDEANCPKYTNYQQLGMGQVLNVAIIKLVTLKNKVWQVLINTLRITVTD